MNRTANLLVVLGLMLGACGSGVSVGAGTTATSIPGVIDAPTTSAAAGSITETTPGVTGDTAVSPAGRAPSGVEGPVAPDFSLVLADGSTFTLSEGSRPVYMVFWAEW